MSALTSKLLDFATKFSIFWHIAPLRFLLVRKVEFAVSARFAWLPNHTSVTFVYCSISYSESMLSTICIMISTISVATGGKWGQLPPPQPAPDSVLRFDLRKSDENHAGRNWGFASCWPDQDFTVLYITYVKTCRTVMNYGTDS